MSKHLKKILVRKPKHLAEVFDRPALFPPSFNVDSKQMPEIKRWEVGHTYHLEIEIKQTSKYQNQRNHTDAGFDIVAYRVVKKSIADLTDEEMNAKAGKAMRS